jgi:hypothetical protein
LPAFLKSIGFRAEFKILPRRGDYLPFALTFGVWRGLPPFCIPARMRMTGFEQVDAGLRRLGER